MDDELKDILKDLGKAINDCISESEQVNRSIQRIRDHGYSLFLLLDVTIGLGKGEKGATGKPSTRVKVTTTSAEQPPPAAAAGGTPAFRMNVADFSFLKSVGIDPTVRRRRRIAAPEPASLSESAADADAEGKEGERIEGAGR